MAIRDLREREIERERETFDFEHFIDISNVTRDLRDRERECVMVAT